MKVHRPFGIVMARPPRCSAVDDGGACVLKPGHKGLHRNGWGVRFR